jgi:hypothetical protein
MPAMDVRIAPLKPADDASIERAADVAPGANGFGEPDMMMATTFRGPSDD